MQNDNSKALEVFMQQRPWANKELAMWCLTFEKNIIFRAIALYDSREASNRTDWRFA